jgi:hypothetical protein
MSEYQRPTSTTQTKQNMNDPKETDHGLSRPPACARGLAFVPILHAFLACSFCQTVVAEVRLPHLISDDMVLQRDLPIPIWGWASPGESVSVTLDGRTASATTGTDGQWSVRLPKMSAGGPYDVIVKGTNTIKLTNVLIGEVWVCAGQSNMENWIMTPMTSDSPKDTNINSASRAVRAGLPPATGRGLWRRCPRLALRRPGA